MVYFWSLYRPDLFTAAGGVRRSACVYDALAGLPLGLTALVLLLVRQPAGRPAALLRWRARSRWSGAASCCWRRRSRSPRWLLASLWWGHLFALQPALLELLLTVALYPPASWLLARLHNQSRG